ncbi:hypothetical protein [Pleomorphovibrio marinus]|uniref:hypothetical protein n=1 Tax=Pleomorphovibrio marinus TaxID=2164132 RepID=UPI000E0C3763|nr:hypothetical protein [Pleomorphovibrio marinus]
MTKDIPYIAVEFPSYFPKDFGDFLTNGIENDLLDIRVLRKELTSWAASEWIVLGLIAVYVLVMPIEWMAAGHKPAEHPSHQRA